MTLSRNYTKLVGGLKSLRRSGTYHLNSMLSLGVGNRSRQRISTLGRRKLLQCILLGRTSFLMSLCWVQVLVNFYWGGFEASIPRYVCRIWFIMHSYSSDLGIRPPGHYCSDRRLGVKHLLTRNFRTGNVANSGFLKDYLTSQISANRPAFDLL